jgi:5'-3' exonuclease
MRVFLVDGTYELFRHYYGVPPHRTAEGAEVAATRGVLWSMLRLLEQGVTHLGVATDHVIESFRNRLWPAYKSSAGLDPRLLGQFGLLEVALEAMGVVVWPMVELEADDALAGAAAAAADDPRVEQVVICTPDKDLGQCVRGGRVVQLDRRNRVVYDEARVTAKFGVAPASIPDYLALVGDSADGYPGLPGWGARSAAAVLAHYGTIEAVPDAPGQWAVALRNRPALAATLAAQRELAMLFKDLATLRVERSLLPEVDALRWTGPTPLFGEVCQRIDARSLATAATRVAGQRRP